KELKKLEKELRSRYRDKKEFRKECVKLELARYCIKENEYYIALNTLKNITCQNQVNKAQALELTKTCQKKLKKN
ncbi:22282_t:CDS:1, partial [Gigaspora margarita]